DPCAQRDVGLSREYHAPGPGGQVGPSRVVVDDALAIDPNDDALRGVARARADLREVRVRVRAATRSRGERTVRPGRLSKVFAVSKFIIRDEPRRAGKHHALPRAFVDDVD